MPFTIYFKGLKEKEKLPISYREFFFSYWQINYLQTETVG